MMNIFCRLLILGLAVLTLACGVPLVAAKEDAKPPTNLQKQISTEIEKLLKSKKPSVSQGILHKGTLTNPAELAAPEGIGYYFAFPTRGSNFGNDRLVFGLMELGGYMREQLGDHPDNRLRIHDLSSKTGGKQKRHVNHQMGLDVDIALYATDLKGNKMSSIWTNYGADGKSKNGLRLFDVDRNWALVMGILKNSYFGEIRSILIADTHRKRLLIHANEQLMKLASKKKEERATLEAIIKKAKKLMRQPKTSPHNNHFHLSLSNVDKR